MNFEWAKYKRFFTFGCSFTNYMWPTWADIVSKEMPNAEFYNFGISGSGNTLISYRIAEANNRYKFTDTDLIMVMFTTYCREDRWLDEKGWLALGNIYNTTNNKYYPESWLRELAHERGYLIRDAAVIDMSMRYLDSLPSTSYCMMAFPFIFAAESSGKKSKPADIISVYENTFNRFPPTMQELEIAANIKVLEYDYKFADGHPSPKRYYSYLKKLGFNLSSETEKYANEMSEVLANIEVRNIVPVYFPDQDANVSKSRELLF